MGLTRLVASQLLYDSEKKVHALKLNLLVRSKSNMSGNQKFSKELVKVVLEAGRVRGE